MRTAVNGSANVASIPSIDRDGATALMRVVAGRLVLPKTLKSLPPYWLDAIEFARDCDPAKRETSLKGYFANVKSRHPREVDTMARAYNAVIIETAVGDLDDEIDPDAPTPYRLNVLGSAALATREFTREWLVKGLLVSGQPCVVGGPRKALKTSLMVDLVVSLGAAERFVGEFEVPRPRKVLFLSGESGDATVQETARRVCAAKGIGLDELEGQVFWGFDLPSLSDPTQLGALADFIREAGIEVVVIDPLYLCLIGGGTKVDPANLFDVGPLLKQITGACLAAGATPLLVHHLRKNRDDADSPPELEDLAYAGVQEFARQWILLGRRERYEPGSGEHKLWLAVGGSAGHSGGWAVDVSEGVVDDDFAGRRWEVKIARASEARQEARQQAEAAKVERITAQTRTKEQAREQAAQRDADTALAALRRRGAASKTEWRDELLGWNSAKFGPAFAYLQACGSIRPAKVTVQNRHGSREISGWEAVDFSNPDLTRTNPDSNPDIRVEPGVAANPDYSGSLPPFLGGEIRESPGYPPGLGVGEAGANGHAPEKSGLDAGGARCI